MSESKEQPGLADRWRLAIAVIYTMAIYATIFIARPITVFLREHSLIYPAILAVFSAVTAASVYCASRHGGDVSGRLVRITLMFALLGVFAFTSLESIEETMHFVEYSILSILIYRALSSAYQSHKLYTMAIAITFVLGWLDEVIQYFVPSRVYDIRDVFLNVLGGCVGLGFVLMFSRDGKNSGATP